MKRALVVGISVLTLGAGSALAADLPVKAPMAPPLAPVFSWTGFYIGANVGGAWGTYTLSTINTFPVPPFFAVDNAGVSAAASPTIKRAGVIGGGQVGYNWQVSNWVFGLEVDFQGQSLRSSANGTFQFPSTVPVGAAPGPGGPPAFFSTATSVSSDWLFTARPRLGWAAGGNWMIYVTGGLAAGRENYTQVITLLSPFVSANSASSTRVGWTVGGGLEWAMSRNWSFKAEYLHVDLGSISGAGVLNPAFAGYFNSTSMRFTEEIGRIGINYRFDAGPVVARY